MNKMYLSDLNPYTDVLKKYPEGLFERIEKDVQNNDTSWTTTKREEAFDCFYLEQNESDLNIDQEFTVSYNLSGVRVIVLSATRTIGKWQLLKKGEGEKTSPSYYLQTITHEKSFTPDDFIDFYNTITVKISRINRYE